MGSAGEVVRALAYLKVTSLKNLVISRARRIRQPKYLLGALFGIAYLWLVFFRPGQTRRGRSPFDAIPTDGLPVLLVFGALAMLAFVALCWALRRQRAALTFSDAEIAFLFPAPISRPALIHYRLVSTGLASLFTAAILALFSRQVAGISPDATIRIIGWWLVFSTLSLHTIGSAFVITRWLDRGIPPLVCQLIAWVAIAALLGGPVAWLWLQAREGIELTREVLEHGPVAWLLYPFRLLLAPLMSPDATAFLKALGPAVLLYAAHYWWVLRAQVGFEEASIAKAEKRAKAVEAIRAGNWRLGSGKVKARRAPFRLDRGGRPELAFLWKNLLSTREYLSLRNALIAAAIIIAAGIGFGDSPFIQSRGAFLGTLLLVLAAYVMLLGPQLARQDLRSDLNNTDILKTYPLRGWQIVLGEILTPAAILTGILWLMLLAGAMLLPDRLPPNMDWMTSAAGLAALGGAALAVPVLCMLQLVVANAATVVFPAWSLNSAARGPQGIEVMGQRILLMVGQILALMLLLAPVVIVAGLAFILVGLIAGNMVAIAVAAVLAAAIMAAEIAAGVWLLGRHFERLDLSEELRP